MWTVHLLKERGSSSPGLELGLYTYHCYFEHPTVNRSSHLLFRWPTSLLSLNSALFIPGTPLDWAAPLQRWCPGPCSHFHCLGQERGWLWNRSGEHLVLWCPAAAAGSALQWWCLEGAGPAWESSPCHGWEPPLTAPDGELRLAQHLGCGSVDWTWTWFPTCCCPTGWNGSGGAGGRVGV